MTTVLAFFVPESPRLLVAKGRTADLQKAMNRMAWFNRRKIEWTDQELAWITENANNDQKKIVSSLATFFNTDVVFLLSKRKKTI